MKPVYLDYAAATPVSDRALYAMLPYYQEKFYNPSSVYTPGRKARADFDDAKSRLARVIGAKPGEIVITSGATESVNLAIQGVMAAHPGSNVVVGATEHHAVLNTARAYDHHIIPVDKRGVIDSAAFESAINDSTVLVSVAYVNSEIGTIQPLADFARIVHGIRRQRALNGNNLPLYFHTDASQAAGFLDVSVGRLGVDFMTLSAAKIYGPKQSGLLFVKAGSVLKPVILGGGQEAGLRSGTEQTALTAGFATALEDAHQHRDYAIKTVHALQQRFEKRVIAAIPETIVHGNVKHRAVHISSLAWVGIDGERLLFMLDDKGIYVSTGAACAANRGTLSPTLAALNIPVAEAQGSIRVSYGKNVSSEDIDQAANILVACVKHLLDNKERLRS